jgi:phospholipid N-methyltransferase
MELFMAADKPLAFLRQTLKDFRTTGALAPSGMFLSRAIAKTLPLDVPDDFKVLEVGPGTGPVTAEICRRMKGKGHLDLYEISTDFCKVLKNRIEKEKVFQPMRGRIHVIEGDVRKLAACGQFDAVISGLPFNNFTPEEVESFIEHFKLLLNPNGSLVWFEYVAIRKLKTLFVGKKTRAQLRGVQAVTSRFVKKHQIRQQIIPINLPPARIRQLKFGSVAVP